MGMMHGVKVKIKLSCVEFSATSIVWRITTTIVLRPFVRDYPGELIPEETFTHSPS